MQNEGDIKPWKGENYVVDCCGKIQEHERSIKLTIFHGIGMWHDQLGGYKVELSLWKTNPGQMAILSLLLPQDWQLKGYEGERA